MENIESVRKKTNLPILIAAVGAALMIPAFFLLKNFFLPGDIDPTALNEAQKDNLKTVTAKISERTALDKFDTELFDDPKFNSLRAYEIKKFDIKELEVGKENPFEP